MTTGHPINKSTFEASAITHYISFSTKLPSLVRAMPFNIDDTQTIVSDTLFLRMFKNGRFTRTRGAQP